MKRSSQGTTVKHSGREPVVTLLSGITINVGISSILLVNTVIAKTLNILNSLSCDRLALVTFCPFWLSLHIFCLLSDPDKFILCLGVFLVTFAYLQRSVLYSITAFICSVVYYTP